MAAKYPEDMLEGHDSFDYPDEDCMEVRNADREQESASALLMEEPTKRLPEISTTSPPKHSTNEYTDKENKSKDFGKNHTRCADRQPRRKDSSSEKPTRATFKAKDSKKADPKVGKKPEGRGPLTSTKFKDNTTSISVENTGKDDPKCKTGKLLNIAVPESPASNKADSKDVKKDKTRRSHSGAARSKKDKAESTTIFLKFASPLGPNVNIMGYLQHCLPEYIEFIIQDRVIDEKSNSTICTLKCQSRRVSSRIKHELHKRNGKSETKVWCFDVLEEAKGTKLYTPKDMDSVLERHVNHIVSRAENVLSAHEKKINEIESQLATMQSKKYKYVSIEEFSSRDKEKRALEDKVQELSKQRVEFQHFLRNVHDKLTEIKVSKYFDRSANEIRRSFAIECARLTNAFPIYARRSDIIRIVTENQVSVIIGETGSGKSTQMAQYLYQTGFANKGLIACTQPRKIAATSLATHVAKEMCTSVGQLIGYKVGMQAKKTELTKIMYMTDHVLLNECLKDRKLSSFSCIIIDEAHERSIYTDLLLGMIKDCLKDRPDLRVIITSATIDPDVFVRYFNECPVLSVSGRMFPVEIEWKQFEPEIEPFGNYMDQAVKKAVLVHKNESDGDILVFLTSPLETEKCCELFQDSMEGRQDYACFQLHGRLQADEQQKVFDPLPKGKRKVVFATNSAETSVTIPGIKYVIDTGLVKEMQFDVKRKINTLAVKMVTQSSANQRKGRAGRTGPGKCFRLYTEEDYMEMQPNSVPEILKVHIGHAMLKLMELDIYPMEFDFVMSPSVDSMEIAIASLMDIGAVREKKITELGKRIAKLPFDPRYGAFVHNAIEKGVGLEAIVIAATCGVGSIFYRSGTNEEKEKADKQKVQFCHIGGDHMTLLNVFQIWHKIPEKQKGRWCFNNSINGKAIKSARETVNEVLYTLKKEMQTEIRFTFCQKKDMDTVLKELLLRTLKENLSCYLGHPKAGYNLLNKDQRVEVHPSSSLMPLGSQQDWIIFDQVMRTSRDFAMNVTPLLEEDVNAIKSGWLTVSIEEAKQKRVVSMCSEFCGTQMFREFVGPRFINLKQLEIDLQSKCPKSLTIVDANRDRSELKILSNEINKSLLQFDLKRKLEPIVQKFKAEESEEKFGTKPVNESVRAIIGIGGCTKTIFMPEEYRTVKIFTAVNLVEELTIEDVKKIFSIYGKIQECQKYNLKHKSPLWGHVMYAETDSAVKAVRQTKGNPDISAKPNVRRALESEGFKTKIQWCRRPSRGFGFVDFTEVDDTLRAVMLNSLLVGGSHSRVKLARNSENSVHISGFSMLVTEDVLRHSVAEALDIDPKNDIRRVNVVRTKVPSNDEIFEILKRRLLRKIEQHATSGKFHLELLKPRDWDVNFTAFCRFDDPEEGHTTCTEINNGFILNEERVTMKANLQCSVYIHKRIFSKSGDEVTACLNKIENENKAVRPKWKKLKNDDVVVELRAENAEALAEARGAVQDIILGDVIECNDVQIARSIFSRNGKTQMGKIMDKTNTLIITDDRSMTISIHGMATDRQRASQRIKEYLHQLTQENVKEVELKGNGKPPGVMKSLLKQYGIDLDGLRTTASLAAVRLDLRFHRLRLIGSDDAIKKATTLVNGVMEHLSSGKIISDENNPECVTCFTPIEPNDIYRLECCGHAYCKECVQLQMESNINSKDFPVECGQEDCSNLFSWKDIFNLSRLGFVVLARLTASSVSCFVSQHKKDFHYCITPDCPVVYKTTETGVPFTCPECSIKICTSCHIQYHDGLSCAMYKTMKDKDGSLKLWMLKDKENRKLCPNCTTPIEKIGGCQHMTCSGCKKHICWICLACFDNSGSCYGHLDSMHGSFM